MDDKIVSLKSCDDDIVQLYREVEALKSALEEREKKLNALIMNDFNELGLVDSPNSEKITYTSDIEPIEVITTLVKGFKVDNAKIQKSPFYNRLCEFEDGLKKEDGSPRFKRTFSVELLDLYITRHPNTSLKISDFTMPIKALRKLGKSTPKKD